MKTKSAIDGAIYFSTENESDDDFCVMETFDVAGDHERKSDFYRPFILGLVYSRVQQGSCSPSISAFRYSLFFPFNTTCGSCYRWLLSSPC